MKNEWVARIIRILCFFLLALVVSTMLVSCDTVTTALQAIGRFFIFVLWLVLAIVGLGFWIFFTYHYFDNVFDYEKRLEKRKRKNKSLPDPEQRNNAWYALYLGFLASLVCIFSITRLLGSVPIWLLVIGALGHAFILFMLLREGCGAKNLPYVWLGSAVILGTLSYIFGLMSRTFEFQAFTITTNPIYCIVASGVLALIPTCVVFTVNKQKLKKAQRLAEEERLRLEREAVEERLRLERETEEKRKREEEEKRRLEEIERNKPIAVKLAELETEAQEQQRKGKQKIDKAKQKFLELNVRYGKSPSDSYLDYLDGRSGGNIPNSDFKEDISGTLGMRQRRYKKLVEVAQYYAAWYQLQMSNVELEIKRYTYCRKKADLFVQRLKDIYAQLTKNQKERKIADVATNFNIDINKLNKRIGQEKFNVTPIQFSGEGMAALTTNFGGVLDTLKTLSGMDISGRSREALVLIGLEAGGAVLETLRDIAEVGIEAIKDAFEKRQYEKERIEREVNKFHRTIRKIIESHLKAETFCEKAGELNVILEEAMNAYEKEFLKVYNMLYPPGDASRSKEARTLNKQNGRFYFSDEEVDPVLRLRVLGKFLDTIIDTEF